MNKVVLTITGPSASGKSTLEQMLCGPVGSMFNRVVSATTRPPRGGECDGSSYHFLTVDQFKRLDADHQLVESNKFGEHYYGATDAEFDKAWAVDCVAVIVVDPNGRDQIEASAQARGWTVISVFVTNPPTVRYERLIKRFITDIECLELGGAPFQAQVERFAERLAITSNVESHWEDMERPYDVVFNVFNEKNQEAVLNHLSAIALNAMLTGDPDTVSTVAAAL